METKQVIVIRRSYPGGLRLRRGKEITQGAHASMAWLTRRLKPGIVSEMAHRDPASDTAWLMWANISVAEKDWLDHSFRKVVCQVETGEELRALHQQATDAGVEAHLITDSGRTELHGEPAITALAVGPDWDDRIDAITGGLTLY